MEMGDVIRTADPGETAASEGLGRVRTIAGRGLWELDVLGRMWRFFTSVRLALFLILMITAAALAGTLINQAPPSVVADPAAYAQWLDRAHTKYGAWTDLMSALGLFNVFHGFWFRLLIGLLTANIIVCSVNRWRGIWSMAFRTRVRMGERFFEHARFRSRMEAAMQPSVAAERVARALGRSRYRVQTDGREDSIAFYADKNRLARFGTIFSHLSLVLILVGAIVGSLWGFSDPQFIVAEGARRDVGLGTGISVELEHFVDEYWIDGPPKDFRSDLIIYDNGVEAKRGTVRVNSPMSYKGVRFHQAFYGQAAVLKVVDENGTVLFDEGVPLAWQSRDLSRPVGSFTLPDRNLDVYVIGSMSGYDDTLVPPGEMRVEVYRQDTSRMLAVSNVVQGDSEELAGLNITFERERRFTGLKVVKDPGVNIIWIASGLMVVGLVLLFYFPHKRIWALCKRGREGHSEVLLGTPVQRDVSQAEDFKRLRKRVSLALGITSEESDPPEGGGNV
jgi:cytochrome c biogenesis protein